MVELCQIVLIGSLNVVLYRYVALDYFHCCLLYCLCVLCRSIIYCYLCDCLSVGEYLTG